MERNGDRILTENPFTETEADKKTVMSLQSESTQDIYPISKPINNNLTLFLLLLSNLLLVLHSLISLLTLTSESTAASVQSVLNFFVDSSWPYRFLQAGMYMVKLVVIFGIYYSRKSKKEHFLHSISEDLMHSAHVVVELELEFSGFILLLSFYQNLPGFGLSVAINLLFNFTLENYHDRKDVMYCSSAPANHILKVSVPLVLLLNAIFHKVGDINLLGIEMGLMGIFFLMWYWLAGFKMHTHTKAAQLTIAFVSLFVSFSLVAVCNLLFEREFISLESSYDFIISVIILGFFLNLLRNSLLQKLIIKMDFKQVKNIELSLQMKKGSVENVDDDAFLLGLFISHEAADCIQVQCYSHFSKIYDPVTKRIVGLKLPDREKETCLKLHLKCYYQHALKQHPSKQLIIDYCEFMINQLGDVPMSALLLAELTTQNLTIFEKMRVINLRRMLLDLSSIQNKDIFQGKLCIEEVLESENLFNTVYLNTLTYIHNNIQIWNFIQKNEINLTPLKSAILDNSILLDQTKRGWSKLSKYLVNNRKWKFIYLHYSLYILNEKINHKGSNKYQSNDSSDQGFEEQNQIYLEPDRERKDYIKQEILFDHNSFYIHTSMKEYKQQIRKVSKNFESILHYTVDEIVGQSLNILLDEQLRLIHDQKVKKWLESGYSGNEELYPIRFTECLEKSGNKIPVLKYFKIFVRLENFSFIEFVALLKFNCKESLFGKQKDKSSPYLEKSAVVHLLNMKPSLNLTSEGNIFIKQENLEPQKHSLEVYQIKIALRLLFFILLFFVFVLSFISRSDALNIQSYSNQYINYMNIYRFPWALGTNYMKSFLNIGNQTKVVAQIAAATRQIQIYANSPLTIKTLFDEDLNPSKLYYPFKANQINLNSSYNQIDLIFLIFSCITSLSKLPIIRTGSDFIMFNSYLKPAYDKVINITKYNFHTSFQQFFSKIHFKQAFIGVSISLIIGIVTIVIFIKIQAFYSKMRRILSIIAEFNSSDVKTIQSYWKNVIFHFSQFDSRATDNHIFSYKSIINTANQSIEFQGQPIQIETHQINLNKRMKKINQDGKDKCQKRKISIVVLLASLAVIAINSSIQIFNYYSIENLQNFEEAGFYFLQYFPTASILGYGCMEKFYSDKYPQEIVFSKSRFQDVIESIQIFGKKEYIGEVSDSTSSFYIKQKNYFYGNPCLYNPSAVNGIGITSAKCMQISNKVFNMGLAAGFRYTGKMAEDYMDGKIQLSASELDQLTVSLTILAVYVLDSITTWASEFSAKVDSFQTININLCITIGCIILFLHLWLCESLLFRKLAQLYQFHASTFHLMVPEYILTTEKVIKQKFIMEGILKQG